MRKERHITQYQSPRTGLWSFKVRIGDVTETFSEKDYGSPTNAMNKAKKFRDNVLANGIKVVKVENKSVREVFEESLVLFPVRLETQKKLRCQFNKYINGKDKDIRDVTSEDIILDLNAMIEIATKETMERVLSLWKKIVQTALYKEYIDKDISMFIKCPQSHKIGKYRVNKVTNRQTIIEMENLCREHLKDPHEKEIIPLLLEFLYLSGCRICEAIAITRKDVHKDYVSINKEVGSSMKEEKTIRKCKTDLSERNIPMTKELSDVLAKAMKLSKNEYIFSKKDGNFFDTTLIGDKIHRIGKTYGYDFNMYSIRHLFATDLTIAGVDERTRIELMGHSNIRTTLGYARSNDELKLNALNNRES